MYNVLIVEDDIIQANAIEKTIQAEYKDMKIFKADTYEKALNIIDNTPFHLFILDIILNNDNFNDNGISLGSIIRGNSQYAHTPILYITSIPDKIIDAVNDIHCYNYLIKPYNSHDLIKAVKALIGSPMMPENPLKFRDLQGITFHIKSEDLLFIKSEYKVLYFHTNNDIFRSRDYRLEQLLSILPTGFVQCHKSYIINTHHISNYDRTTRYIRLDNNNLIPVGRKYKELLEKRI